MVYGGVHSSQPASQPPFQSQSAPFLSLQTPPMGRARAHGGEPARSPASSLVRSPSAPKEEEGTSLKFISQPPPPPMLPPPIPPLARARPLRRHCCRFGKQKESPCRSGPQRSHSPSLLSLFLSLSTVLPKRDEADSLTAPPQRGGSNFWM